MTYAAQSPSDLLPHDQILSMSGLDFMLGILRGEIASAPIAEPMGMNIRHVEEGRVVFEGTPTFQTLNPSGGVHGGWYGTLLDSAMGCAVMTKVPQGSVYTTLEYKVNIARAVTLGTTLLCEAVIDHAGRSTAVAHATMRGEQDGKIYATGSTTCIIMKLKA
ncbi:MAG: PaaI family thioesterase [Pseudomonadota bacterium]